MSNVWFILMSEFALFDASASMQVFGTANDVLRSEGRRDNYSLRVFSAAAPPVFSSLGIALKACALPRGLARRVDVLIVAGGSPRRVRQRSREQLAIGQWLGQHRQRIAWVGTIGADAFVAVHSLEADTQAPFVAANVHAAALTGGLEQALDIVAHDLGPEVAAQVASVLAPFAMRPESKGKFVSGLSRIEVRDERVRELNAWIARHLHERLSVECLARHMAMTPRTFARFYLRATGMTPARAVEQLRLEQACRAAAMTLRSFKSIARQCGFSSEEVMRRTFLRVLRMRPSEYRQRQGRTP